MARSMSIDNLVSGVCVWYVVSHVQDLMEVDGVAVMTSISCILIVIYVLDT
jgi:hypothetical protein